MRVALPSVAVTILVIVAFGTGGNAAALAIADSGPSRPSSANSGVGPPTNVSFGAHLSAFMQANAARTSDSVETGMWAASYANATTNSSRTAIATGQRERLKRRIKVLRAEKLALRAAMENGTISRVTYQARLGRLVGRLTALEHAFRVANRTNASVFNQGELRELRKRAAGLAGEDVSRMARGLQPSTGQGGPPAWLTPPGQGPSGGVEAGPPTPGPSQNDNQSSGAGNESVTPGNDGSGQGNGGSGQGKGK